jgi:hypothetical protein
VPHYHAQPAEAEVPEQENHYFQVRSRGKRLANTDDSASSPILLPGELIFSCTPLSPRSSCSILIAPGNYVGSCGARPGLDGLGSATRKRKTGSLHLYLRVLAFSSAAELHGALRVYKDAFPANLVLLTCIRQSQANVAQDQAAPLSLC